MSHHDNDDCPHLVPMRLLEAENDRLKAEVERLRKAGDELSNALAAFHLIHRGKIDTTTQPDIVAWNSAKEGKQP